MTGDHSGCIKSLHTSRLLITFSNGLDPDQARQIVRPSLDPNYLNNLMIFLKEFLKKLI